MLELKNILGHPEYKKAVKKLYVQAFPKEERVPLVTLLRKARAGAGEFSAVCDGDGFVGITYNIFFQDMVYLFYLAVVPEKRNGGYGGQILEELKARCPGKRILISVEELDPRAEDLELRKRRKAFYEHHGFRDAAIKFREFDVTYEMLSYGGGFKAEEYAALMTDFRGKRLFRKYFQRVE